jgi:hypothetical protein
MKDNFVSYEIALYMKELGFDEPCFGWWFADEEMLIIEKSTKSTSENIIQAPTFSQAFNFFEGKYGYFVDRDVLCSANEVIAMDYYIKSINGTIQIEFPADYSEFDYYESKNICLNKLIEIIKSRNKRDNRVINN